MRYEPRPSPITFWTIAFAVMLGILMADVTRTVVIAVYAKIQLNNVIRELNAQTRKEQAQAKEREFEARVKAEADAKAAQLRIDAQRQAEALAHQRAIEKEQAWHNFYTPPKVCIDPPDAATFTKCANDHIKAKTQFEATYRPQQR